MPRDRICRLPPAEAAFHPGETSGKHELYLMCEDIDAFIAQMRERRVACTEPREEPWGRLIDITLPDGGALGVYQPRHERP